MIETDLMIEFGQIMDETEQWAGLFESFCFKTKYLIERQKRALQHFADENENLKSENSKLRAKNRRMKHMFVGFGNRFKELDVTPSPKNVKGQQLMTSESDDDGEVNAPSPLDMNFFPSPGSPVFPGLVTRGPKTQQTTTTDNSDSENEADKAKALGPCAFKMLMQQKQASPKRSPRKTPSKKRMRPLTSSSGQSPINKKEQTGKMKQLRMDLFSPKKSSANEATDGNTEVLNSESESSQSPFKVPKSPASRSLYQKFSTPIVAPDERNSSRSPTTPEPDDNSPADRPVKEEPA